MKLFYLFLYYGEIRGEAVAMKHCNLTPNPCTEGCAQKNEKAHMDKFQGFGPDLSGTFTRRQRFWTLKKWEDILFLFLFFVFFVFFCFWGTGQFMYLTV